jgi:hypothetical protein
VAERPIFVPAVDEKKFVEEINFNISWASGFAPVQKKKNINALHAAAEKAGFFPLLEISTKSDVIAGRHLSAFHLKISTAAGDIPLECAFQGSKIFENGGPYTDIYTMDAREAKRDPRLRESGLLMGFEFDNNNFPLLPLTVFYDWLYLSAIFPYREWLFERLTRREVYAGFTDIEFNPKKSINCQARSCTLFVSLFERGLFEEALRSSSNFIEIMKKHDSWEKQLRIAPRKFDCR